MEKKKVIDIKEIQKDVQTLNSLAGDDQAFELWSEKEKDAFDNVTTKHVAELIKVLNKQSDIIKSLKTIEKSYNELDAKIGKFYGDENAESDGDLGDIGEVAASHFGYL